MIEALIAQNEGKTLEFKESTRSLPGIIKAVIAFANTAGGTIVIGVRDGNKELVGVVDVLREEERLANTIADSVSPLLVPDIEIHLFKGKEFLVIRVPHSAGPHFLKSEGPDKGVYVRLGSTNRIADASTVSILRLFAQNISYDELPHPRGKLNSELIHEVFAVVKKRPTQQTWESLGLVSSHLGKMYPSNGGVLLFGANRFELFPDSLIRCARFAGNTKKDPILDQIEVREALPEAVDPIIRFIERNVRLEAKIGRIYREDILEYPPLAIREAVLNAILHTDYSMQGCPIQVAIFDDRIEIINPGALPVGLTLDKALEGVSRVRNRVIGRVFKELRLIEQWGAGILRILDVCKKRGLRTPVFEELNNQFRVILYSAQVEAIAIEPWGQELLNYMKLEGAVTAKQAAQLWNIAPRTARLRLKSLQGGGFIVRVGSSENDPSGTYIAVGKKSAI